MVAATDAVIAIFELDRIINKKSTVMKMLGKALTLLLAVMATLAADAQQKLTWSVDFGTVFENREGDNYYSPDQTIFFTRLSPEVGLSMLDGMHNIAGGVSWIQPVGNGWRDYKLCPTLYYSYKSPTWRVAVGMLPRTMLLEEMHTVLLSDSMRYRQPNIRGVLLQYVKPKGFFELSLDWRSLQTDTQREAFNVNFNGRWNPCGALLVGGRVQLNHLAKSSSDYEDQGVNDDITVNPYVGLNLSHRSALDSLEIKAGPIINIERDRRYDDGWRVPCGVLVDAVAEWRRLGIKETFYAGKNLYPLYPRYGSLLNMGDPNYQAKLYSRTDVYAYIFRNKYVDFRASLDFHYTKEAFTFWQNLTVRVFIGKR